MARILIIAIWIPFSSIFPVFDTLFAFRAHPWFGYPFYAFFFLSSIWYGLQWKWPPPPPPGIVIHQYLLFQQKYQARVWWVGPKTCRISEQRPHESHRRRWSRSYSCWVRHGCWRYHRALWSTRAGWTACWCAGWTRFRTAGAPAETAAAGGGETRMGRLYFETLKWTTVWWGKMRRRWENLGQASQKDRYLPVVLPSGLYPWSNVRMAIYCKGL